MKIFPLKMLYSIISFKNNKIAIETDFHNIANIYFTVTYIMKTQLEKGESL